MRYTCPQVLATTTAVTAIKGSPKGVGQNDFPAEMPSIAAYEADE